MPIKAAASADSAPTSYQDVVKNVISNAASSIQPTVNANAEFVSSINNEPKEGNYEIASNVGEDTKDGGFDFGSMIDGVGNFVGTALDVMDAPNVWIGNGLDWLYDTTIGELTGTRDLFSGEDAAWIPRIASMFIPGGAVAGTGLKALGSLRNLKNVDKFEKAVSNVMNTKRFKDNTNTFANSINGKIAAYADKMGYDEAMLSKLPRLNDLTRTYEGVGGRGRKYLGQGKRGADKNYILAGERDMNAFNDGLKGRGLKDRWGDPLVGISDDYKHFKPIGSDAADAQRLVEENAFMTDIPLYRGGYRKDGTYWTPDARLANSYKRTTDGRALDRGFDDGSKLFVIKGKKETSPGLMTGGGTIYNGPMARETFLDSYTGYDKAKELGPIADFMTPNLNRKFDAIIDGIVSNLYKKKK